VNGKINVKVKLLLVNLMIFIGFCCFCGVMFLALPSWVVVIMAVLSMSKVAGEIINKIISLKKCCRVIYLLKLNCARIRTARVSFMTPPILYIGIKSIFLDLKNINKCDLCRLGC